MSRYRCSLPGLTGFVTSRREDANASRHNSNGIDVAEWVGFEPTMGF